MIVYKVENKVNGKIYIGATTKSLSERIKTHLRDVTKVGQAIHVYGIQSFIISVIDNAESKKVLYEKEKYWIQHYDCRHPKGYNKTDGGIGLTNPTQDVRDNISEKVKELPKNDNFTFSGHKHDKKTKKKISETLKKTFSDPEIKKKLSESRKGRVVSEETGRKISEAKTGKKRTDKVWNKGLTLKGTPGYVNSMKGKKRPDVSERNRNNKNIDEIQVYLAANKFN